MTATYADVRPEVSMAIQEVTEQLLQSERKRTQIPGALIRINSCRPICGRKAGQCFVFLDEVQFLLRDEPDSPPYLSKDKYTFAITFDERTLDDQTWYFRKGPIRRGYWKP